MSQLTIIKGVVAFQSLNYLFIRGCFIYNAFKRGIHILSLRPNEFHPHSGIYINNCISYVECLHLGLTERCHFFVKIIGLETWRSYSQSYIRNFMLTLMLYSTCFALIHLIFKHVVSKILVDKNDLLTI